MTPALDGDALVSRGLHEGLSTQRVVVSEVIVQKRVNWRTVFQLVAMSLGAGIFAVPVAFAKLGSIHGAVWCLVMGFCSNFAMQRLLDVAAQHKLSSYEALAERAFGRCGSRLMSLITVTTCFCGSVSYLATSRDLLVSGAIGFFLDVDVNAQSINSKPVTVEVLPGLRKVAFLTAIAVIFMPSCVKPTLGAHAEVAKYGVLCMSAAAIYFTGFCLVLLTGLATTTRIRGDAPPLAEFNVADMFVEVATLAFPYSVIFAVFPVLQEDTSGDMIGAIARLKPCVATAVSMCCLIYVVVGLVGCLTFGTTTADIALSNLDMTSELTQGVVLLVGAMAAAMLPIISFPVFGALQDLGCGTRPATFVDGQGPVSATMGRPQSRSICGQANQRAWLVFTVGLVMVVTDAFLPTSTAFALAGSLGLATAAYIMPCLLYMRLNGSAYSNEEPTSSESLSFRRVEDASAPPSPAASGGLLTSVITFVVLAFGLALLFGSTPLTVYRSMNGTDGGKGISLKRALCLT
eukprot:TRINITY_DN48249_c0_g1_i1.p1 TRINITY_DN48249_c0_g1~~TRINITY_DN48249_c0_g1_i1.p1  ORF type:complete len:518 (+),score=71.13 TRINITY_DN48249_c0_g1_i1:64-1617(+)